MLAHKNDRLMNSPKDNQTRTIKWTYKLAGVGFILGFTIGIFMDSMGIAGVIGIFFGGITGIILDKVK